MDKFFGIDMNLLRNGTQKQLQKELMDKTVTEHAFMSTGVAKGKGLADKPIIFNIYSPSGTKMMYAEPFSAYGNGSGHSWDGIAKQTSFGREAEMILQRETKFKVTKVEKKNGTLYVDIEVISQER